MEQTPVLQKRIQSIDVLRGIVMVIMALDHVRDYMHISANTDDPLNLANTTAPLYFTRWITHFCAPVFVFLSGTSIYLQSLRKTKKELGIFLLKRGGWLIFAECVLIGFGWTFNPFFNVFFLQVIWAIGISMVLLGVMLLLRLPYRLIFILGILIVAGHNLLDIPESKPGFKASFWWDLFHHGFFVTYQYAPNYFLLMVYPFGKLFSSDFSAEQRRKILLYTGSGLILFFIALRYSNVYGDPFAWSRQQDGFHTFLSFIKVHKYPPSLLYMCITIGPALIVLALIENVQNRFTGWMRIYGRTAFFYYILHIYLIHIIATVCFFARGGTMTEASNSARQLPFLFVIPGQGYNLWIVYATWLAVVLALYPLCKRYDHYKTLHKEKWWLSYL
jgi:uncharacterized membrane protein